MWRTDVKWKYVYDFDPGFMLGKTPKVIIEGGSYKDELVFEFTDGSKCMFYHSQDCCESVQIEDVNGSWSDLIGHPLLVAEERVSREKPKGVETDPWAESETWTFYTFRSIGGSVDVRWYGNSNGYYSESVDFATYTPGEN
jgi:hypothetical protein